jgi:hypothetical protein
MLDMNTAAAATTSAPAPAAAPAARRLVLMPDSARSDESVRRYRLARLRLEPRDAADPFGHLKRSYD